MTDMNPIDAEAVRRARLTTNWLTTEREESAVIFANIRDQLIKEGWTPEPDVAQLLWKKLECSRTWQLNDIRAALAKARAHPADVVEAARSFKAYPRGMASEENTKTICDYLLKDAP